MEYKNKSIFNLNLIEKYNYKNIIDYINNNNNLTKVKFSELHKFNNRWLFAFDSNYGRYFWALKFSNFNKDYNAKEDYLKKIIFMYFWREREICTKVNYGLYNLTKLDYIAPSNILDYRLSQIYNFIINKGEE